jgi:hypothetical protein
MMLPNDSMLSIVDASVQIILTAAFTLIKNKNGLLAGNYRLKGQG